MAWDLCQIQHFPLPAMTAKQKDLPLFVLQQVGEQPRGALIIQLGKAVVKDDRAHGFLHTEDPAVPDASPDRSDRHFHC